MRVFLLSQAMLTAMLLSCVLLSALPPTLGVQMGVAPLKVIRRPDQALFPEFPGEYGQLGGCVGQRPLLATDLPAQVKTSFPNPNLGRWVLGAWWV